MGKEISAQRKHIYLYHLMGREIPGDMLNVERAVILYNQCWLSLKDRKKDTSNNPHVLIDIPISKLVSWLMLSFVLCREVPALFQKVSRLLAAIFSLSTSSVLEAPLSTSCKDLCGRHWVCFFHQASLGIQFNYQFSMKEVQQGTDTKDDALKGGFGGSKAYGDLSKCGKPAMTEESSQKQQPSDIDESNIKRKGGIVTEEDIVDEDSDYDYDFFDEHVVKRSDPTEEEILEIMAQEHDHRRCIELQEKALKGEYASQNPADSLLFNWPWEEEFESKPMDVSELVEILGEVDGTYECLDAAFREGVGFFN